MLTSVQLPMIKLTPESNKRPHKPMLGAAPKQWSAAKRSLSRDHLQTVSEEDNQPYQLLKDAGSLFECKVDDDDTLTKGTTSSIDSLEKLGLRTMSLESISSSKWHRSPTPCSMSQQASLRPDYGRDTPPSSSAAFEMSQLLARCPPPKRPRAIRANSGTLPSLEIAHNL